MDATLFDQLRYRSEGTDLDFKSAQYRFVRGTETDKAELLKDVLAIANAWREGTGYILLGFKEDRPSPAEVVGISDHLDDAAIQQFVGSKVKPKLSFKYEEHLYEGKRIAVIAIPKQQRPFYLQHPYAGLKSNVVYVRRGSSTDEAEPLEVIKMAGADAGRGNAQLDLIATHPDGTPLEPVYERQFLTFGTLPDFEFRRTTSVFDVLAPLSSFANRDYWRQLARFGREQLSVIQVQLRLTNRSTFPLSDAKVEVQVTSLDAPPLQLKLGDELVEHPPHEHSYDLVSRLTQSMPSLNNKMRIEKESQIYHVRLGTLLPGESGLASDTIAMLPSGEGRLRLKYRILAAELPNPVENEHLIEVRGESKHYEVEQMQRVADQLRFRRANPAQQGPSDDAPTVDC